jgi:glycerol-3-phosphate dehydrogenase
VQEPRFITLNIEEKNKKIETDPRYGHIICRCEKVSEQEVVEAIYKGAKTLDGVKFRTRAGMGRCQGGFCTSRVLQIMARELDVSLLDLRKKGGNSYLLKCGTKDLLEARS